MTESSKTISIHDVASKGGKLRAFSLSPERRKEIARKAGLSKGTKGLPRAAYGGILKLGDKEIECGVLPDKTRVVSCASIRSALGLSNPNAKDRKRAKEANLPTFLSSHALTPYFEEVFGKEGCLKNYVNKGGQKIEGMEATGLPKICEVYLKALLEKKLLKQQIQTAKSCEIILSALAKVGVIALVDESSGYQEERARNELQTFLQKFISEDLLKWIQRFPHQFFREVYRLHGWVYKEGQCRHPHYLGKFINKYIYQAISPEVLDELKRRNPVIEEKGRRMSCQHQHLSSDVGQPALDKHLLQTIVLMKASSTKHEFSDLFEKAFKDN